MSSNVVLAFREVVVAGIGNIVLTPSTGSATTVAADAPQVTFSSSACTITPTSNILDSVQYTVNNNMGSGVITDPGINVATSTNTYAGLSGTTYQFVTEDLTPPTMSTYSPGSIGRPHNHSCVLKCCFDFQRGGGCRDQEHCSDSVYRLRNNNRS